MNTTTGNLLDLADHGHFDVIVHGCNCFCTMNAGIAKQIRERYPHAFKADLSTVSGNHNKLGSFSSAVIPRTDGTSFVIVNGYTQYRYGTGLQVDYQAIRSVFRLIKSNYSGSRIGFPLIGAGYGGGDWSVISKIIEEELMSESLTCVILN